MAARKASRGIQRTREVIRRNIAIGLLVTGIILFVLAFMPWTSALSTNQPVLQPSSTIVAQSFAIFGIVMIIAAYLGAKARML